MNLRAFTMSPFWQLSGTHTLRKKKKKNVVLRRCHLADTLYIRGARGNFFAFSEIFAWHRIYILNVGKIATRLHLLADDHCQVKLY